VCGGHSAHDDDRMWAEGPAVPAASQRNGRHSSCRIKHDSEYSPEDRSAAVNAADDTTADDGVWAAGQEEQRREFAAPEVGESQLVGVQRICPARRED
jgi:hypothetical protein